MPGGRTRERRAAVLAAVRAAGFATPEKLVEHCLAQELSDRDIAARLGVSQRTVRYYRSRIIPAGPLACETCRLAARCAAGLRQVRPVPCEKFLPWELEHPYERA